MKKKSRIVTYRPRRDYWTRVADGEFLAMDADAQAQWRELRP